MIFEKIFTIIIMVAYLIAAFLSVGSVGYFLYEWAVVNVTLKVALWEAFKLYLYGVGVVIVLIMLAYIVSYFKGRK